MVVQLIAVLTMTIAATAGTITLDFENVSIGQIPTGWKTMSGFTSGSAPIKADSTCAAKYEVVANATVPNAPAGNKVLTISSHLDNVYDNGHHCWTDAISVADLTIAADIMAADTKKGHCGFSFRIKNHKNFYGIRYAIVEGNLYMFKVKDGNFNSPGIATTTAAPIGSGEKGTNKWVKFKVEVKDATIKAYINDILRVTYTDASPIAAAGGVGLFSRGADAIVSWDNVTITSDNISTAVLFSEPLPYAPRMLERQSQAASAYYSLLGRKIAVNPHPVSTKTATLVIMKTGSTGTVIKNVYRK